MTHTSSVLAAAFSSSLFLFSAVSLAQENPTPSRSVESFQSWTVECNNIEVAVSDSAETQFNRICEVIQTYYNSKTRTEVARLVFGIDEKNPDTLVGAIRTVVNVSFQNNASIVSEEKEIFSGSFSRCIGTYCYAQLPVTDESFSALEGAENAQLQYALGNGALLSIPISNNGLSDAMKALKARAE